MDGGQIHQFQEKVWDYYHAHGRDLPWRHEPFDQYKILVSEVMLQQTQVTRVIPKYGEFLDLFPDVKTLSQASLADVIKAWSGLGYNRRAKYLHDAAKQLAVINRQWTLEDLVACKGIGHNTAAAVMAYACNQPVEFIETNVRTVYIHQFFRDQQEIADRDILSLVAQSLDHEHPREWYWALMDYGAYLKANVGNLSRLSKHHTKQSKFEGSARQIRGQVLKVLAKEPQDLKQLRTRLPDERLLKVLEDLCQEGLISRANKRYLLTS